MTDRVSSFNPVLWRVGWRYLSRHGWQSLFMILGIALGVAVAVSIDLANVSASQAFDLSTEAVAGRATHEITGGPAGLDDSLYARLAQSGLVDDATPVMAEFVESPQLGGQTFQLLGVDPFTDSPFRAYWGEQSSLPVDQLAAFLTRPGALLLSVETAERFGLNLGDGLTIRSGGQDHAAFVSGIIEPDDDLSRRTLSGALLADIATAQELTGRIGRLDRIDLILPEDDPGLVERVRNWLPQGVQLTAVAARSGSVAEMTAAFRLNLTALSMLALVVGIFLIYNTMTFSVVQRRPLFGTLRCLGVTRREVFGMVLVEALLVGAVGSSLGILLGILMGRQTVAMVSQTINDLYFTTTVQSSTIAASSLIKGAVLGIGASLLAALVPAREAAQVPPQAALIRSRLEQHTRSMVLWSGLAGLVTAILGLAVFLVPEAGGPAGLITGFAGTFLVVIGFALLAALVMVGLMRLVTPLSGWVFGFLGRMAPRNLLNSLSRTSVAVASLMVAVAVSIGVGLMIGSFRHTVSIWLTETLKGDIYISGTTYAGTMPSTLIEPGVIETAGGWPGVDAVNLGRWVVLNSDRGPVQTSVITNQSIGLERMFMRADMPAEQAWQALESGSVFVSEPLARRLNLMEPGAELRLFTDTGWQSFPVAAVYYDYASSAGNLQMAMNVYQRYWNDPGITSVDLRLEPGTDPDQVVQELRNALAGQQQLVIRANSTLRAVVLEIFDRTFAITAALRILTTVVAFIGVMNTLLLLQLEKQREVGILRALGLTGQQLWKLVMLETGLMGLVAGLLAAPTGYALSLILIYIINQRSFGWTLQRAVQPEIFVQALFISLAAALLAGIYPALKMSRTTAAEVIRYE